MAEVPLCSVDTGFCNVFVTAFNAVTHMTSYATLHVYTYVLVTHECTSNMGNPVYMGMGQGRDQQLVLSLAPTLARAVSRAH